MSNRIQRDNLRIDLHMHSTASDGVYSPAEVVRIARTNNMGVIALTDHDNADGIRPAQQAASESGMQVLAGVELSSEDDEADRHILGYLFDPADAPFQAKLATLRDGRVNRIKLMVEKLAALGVNVPLDRVYTIAGSGSVGRPHLAQALLERGYVGSISEAFNLYLGDDRAAYVPHHRLTPDDAIALIHNAGGVAVLAHPGHYEHYEYIIEALLPKGLDGVETYYPDHTPDIIHNLRVLAQRHDLVMTVGSDFHRRNADGSAKIGSVKFPPDLKVIEALQARAARYQTAQ